VQKKLTLQASEDNRLLLAEKRVLETEKKALERRCGYSSECSGIRKEMKNMNCICI